jgi:hypothetical protein
VTNEPLNLRIEVALPAGADAEELDEVTRGLRSELLELDVDAVDRPAAGPAPEGARAVEVALLGTLVVALGRGALGIVGRTVERWAARGGERHVVLEIDGDRLEVTGVSAEDQRRLIDTFVARHAGGAEGWTAGSP